MAQQAIRIDNIALWKPVKALPDGQFNVKAVPAGVQYLPKGSSVYQISTEPMYRYVKNYYAGEGELRVQFSLFVRTFIDANNTIVAQLDEIAEQITIDQAKEVIDDPDMLNFKYLNKYVDENYIVVEKEPEIVPEEPVDEVIEEETEDLPSDDEEAVESASDGEDDTETTDDEQEESVDEAEKVDDDENTDEVDEEIAEEDTTNKDKEEK